MHLTWKACTVCARCSDVLGQHGGQCEKESHTFPDPSFDLMWKNIDLLVVGGELSIPHPSIKLGGCLSSGVGIATMTRVVRRRSCVSLESLTCLRSVQRRATIQAHWPLQKKNARTIQSRLVATLRIKHEEMASGHRGATKPA